MFAIIYLLAAFIVDLFKPPRRLEVENLFLRHQLNIPLRRAPRRVPLQAADRAVAHVLRRRWTRLSYDPCLRLHSSAITPSTAFATSSWALGAWSMLRQSN